MGSGSALAVCAGGPGWTPVQSMDWTK